jgi:hypothetical protein
VLEKVAVTYKVTGNISPVPTYTAIDSVKERPYYYYQEF